MLVYICLFALVVGLLIWQALPYIVALAALYAVVKLCRTLVRS